MPSTAVSTTSALETELRSVRHALSTQETEDSWESIAKAIQQLTNLVLRSTALPSQDLLRVLRPLVHPINDAVLSERSRLSAAAIEFLVSATREVPRTFEALIPNFFPALLILSSRSNKVFITRARACIIAVIQTTQSPLILSYLAQNARDKSVPLRHTVAEAAVACLNTFNPPDLQRDSRGKEIELIIKSAATDANPEIRKLGKKMYDAYKVLLPERVESFTTPLTPTIRKYLNISAKPTVQAARPTPSQRYANPPSRPTSALSTRSGLASSSSSAPADSQHYRSSTTESRSLAPSQHPASSLSLSSLGAQQPGSSTQPPLRPHSVLGTVALSSSSLPAATAQKARRHDMPPPDFIPSRSQPTRPVAEPSYPEQRQRAGPMRPANVQSLSQDGTAEGSAVAAAVKRAGGARRVLLPEAPAPSPPSPSELRPQESDPELAQDRARSAEVEATRARTTSASLPMNKHEPEGHDALRRPLSDPTRENSAPKQTHRETNTSATHRPTSRTEAKPSTSNLRTHSSNSSSQRETRVNAAPQRHQVHASRAQEPQRRTPPPQDRIDTQDKTHVIAAATSSKRSATVKNDRTTHLTRSDHSTRPVEPQGRADVPANVNTRRRGPAGSSGHGVAGPKPQQTRNQAHTRTQASTAPPKKLPPPPAPYPSGKPRAGVSLRSLPAVEPSVAAAVPLPATPKNNVVQLISSDGEEEEEADSAVQQPPAAVSRASDGHEDIDDEGHENSEHAAEPQPFNSVSEAESNHSEETDAVQKLEDAPGTSSPISVTESDAHGDTVDVRTPSPASPPPPPTPPALLFAVNDGTPKVVMTPKASSSRSLPAMVEQTPISALVRSIEQGFMFTPRPGDASLSFIGEEDEDEWQGDMTFVHTNDADLANFGSQPLSTLPLHWGTKERSHEEVRS